MAKSRKKKQQKKQHFDDISPHTKQAIGAVFASVLAIYFILSSMGYAGVAGDLTQEGLSYMFGYGFVLAPVVCLLYVYVFLKPRDDERMSTSKALGVTLLFLSSLGLLALYAEGGGGIIGTGVSLPFVMFIGTIVSAVVLGAFFLIGIFLTFNVGLHMPHLFSRRSDEEDEDEEVFEVERAVAGEETEEEEDEEEETDEAPKQKKTITERIGLKRSDFVVSNFQGPYDPPPLSLLERDGNKAKAGDIKSNSNIIKRTLKNFKIDVEMDEVEIGPSFTRYALKPAEGVHVGRIVGVQSNLELALAASPIRIEAPIPGKSLVGIEVPNSQRQRIGLAALLSTPEYTDSPKPLLVALGKDITGKAKFANIAKMPHVLIAGTTGSGKSVTIHNLIISLLFRNSPEQLRFIMVDPKRVELTNYNGIPHLLTPVITDAKKTLLSLKWATKEMERRYDILEAEKVRDIESYHSKVYAPAKAAFQKNGEPEEERDSLPEPLPYIVIIIDELSDLMSAYPRELEASIVRLAQMSRAVGIHIILATQRPEVKVITGLIKANVPCRVALKVNSLIDSRTILDQPGAEKLLGNGDMLFLSPEGPKPTRLQSAMVTEEELKKVVSYLKKQTDAQELDAIDLGGDGKSSDPDAFFSAGLDDEDEDDLYEDARVAVVEAGRASTSYLQRKFRIGYSRAARLIDMLEERGVVGPQDGSKPREILEGAPHHDEDEDDV